MSQTFQCPQCGQKYAYRPELVGRQIRCTKCAHVFHLSPSPSVQAIVTPGQADRGRTSGVGSILNQMESDSVVVGPGPVLPGKGGPLAPIRRSPVRYETISHKEKAAIVVGGLLGLVAAVELPIFGVAGVPSGTVCLLGLLFWTAVSGMMGAMLRKKPTVALSAAGGVLVAILIGMGLASVAGSSSAAPAAPIPPHDAAAPLPVAANPAPFATAPSPAMPVPAASAPLRLPAAALRRCKTIS
ncbi:MAG: hypothetical protein ACLQNE_41325 [Thermoguttaceae bacterium]